MTTIQHRCEHEYRQEPAVKLTTGEQALAWNALREIRLSCNALQNWQDPEIDRIREHVDSLWRVLGLDI